MYPFPPEQSETTLLQTTRGHVAIINTLENVEEIETFEKENEQEMPYTVRKTFFKLLPYLCSVGFSDFANEQLGTILVQSEPAVDIGHDQ